MKAIVLSRAGWIRLQPSTGGRRRRWARITAVTLPVLAFLGACVSSPVTTRDRRVRTQPPPRSLPIPVEGVAKSQLRDSYGDLRSGGRRHEGIDIFAGRHTPVLSATEGYVSGLGRNRLGGLVVWVTGPGGWRHYYAHLERWSDVREGQWVEPGTIIGYVGNSGNASTTPTHLHYGIYPTSGGTINPYPLLANGPGTVIARQPSPGSAPGRNPPPERTERAGRDLPAEAEAEVRRAGRRLGERILREVLGNPPD